LSRLRKRQKAQWVRLTACDPDKPCPDKARYHWRIITDPTSVATVQPVGADAKRAHLADIRRERLIEQILTPGILPPEGKR